MTRQEYMAHPGPEEHRKYYGQFVTPEIKAYVRDRIGYETLKRSTDPHMNDIPLHRWDAMHRMAPPSTWRAFKDVGDAGVSLGNSVCLHKEAARQILEEATIDQP
jgi:hypothetical protein